jgi:putative ABC transport system substrate-binding protein
MRRAVVAVAVAFMIAPLVALGQSREVPTVGVLTAGAENTAISAQGRKAFERGLMAAGWIPGRNVRLEYRYGEGNLRQLEEQARELVHLPADVIVARSTAAIRAARQATPTVPIVMSASGLDPIEIGLVTSLARPGGNVTGLTLLIADLLIKQLELLRETVPRLSRVAVLGGTGSPLTPKGRQDLDAAARGVGVRLFYLDVQTQKDLEPAFEEIARWRADGLLVRADPVVLEAHQRRVVALAEKHRLPATYWLYTYADAGGLLSYGADLFSVHERSAVFVDRILRGARPAELPIEEPSKFDLIVNLGAARALGLTISPSVRARASRIIH